MNMNLLNDFMSGAIAMGFIVIAFLFCSFWRRSRTTLLGHFGIAFALLAVERVVLLFVIGQDEFKPFVYMIRLVAFLVIIVSVIWHNRRSG